MLTSVLTGDIIKSRSHKNSDVWISALKNAFAHLKLDATSWNIYRGDSFQLELKDTASSFIAAVYLKACIKSIKNLDVRLAIGIGKKTYSGNTVTESNGEAFIFSGETLEVLKKSKQNLKIKTHNSAVNENLNLCFRLLLIGMDTWTVNSAEIIKLSIEKPQALQSELGKIIGINQNAISMRQKRAHLAEVLELNKFYHKKIAEL